MSRSNALKGRRFASLSEQNAHLRWWEAHVADTRIHGTTQQQVGKLFEQVEKPALQPLPAERFPCFEEAQRSVHRDGHVAVAKAYYSVPPEYLGRQVWVRWDSRLVRIFNSRMEQIAMHVRQEPGQFSTLDQHILDRKIAGVERGTAWLLSKTQIIGPHARRWGEAMVRHRGIEGVRVLQGLSPWPTVSPASRSTRRANWRWSMAASACGRSANWCDATWSTPTSSRRCPSIPGRTSDHSAAERLRPTRARSIPRTHGDKTDERNVANQSAETAAVGPGPEPGRAACRKRPATSSATPSSWS